MVQVHKQNTPRKIHPALKSRLEMLNSTQQTLHFHYSVINSPKSHWEKPFCVFSCHLAAGKYNYTFMPVWIRHHVCSQSSYKDAERTPRSYSTVAGGGGGAGLRGAVVGGGGKKEAKVKSMERRGWRFTVHRSAGSCPREPPAAPASPPAEKRQVHFTTAPPVRPINTYTGLLSYSRASWLLYMYGDVHLITNQWEIKWINTDKE